MALQFYMQCDAIELSGNNIIIGLSNLEGNIWDGAIKLINVENGTETCSHNCIAGITSVKSMVNIDAHSTVIAGRDDGILSIFDIQQSQLLPIKEFRAHNDVISALSVPDVQESRFFSAGWDNAINLWDITALEQPIFKISGAHSGQITDIDVEYNSLMLASVGMDGFLRLWDSRVNPSQGCSQILNLGQAGSCVHFPKYSDCLVLAGTDAGDVLSYDIRFAGSSNEKYGDAVKVPAHNLRVRNIRTSSMRPGLVLSCSDDTTIALYNLALDHSNNFSEIIRFSIHSDYVSSVAWLPSQSKEGPDIVYSVSWDKSLKQSVINFNDFR